ncbi:hypothetical protein, partial [Klebsiella quasipneumoniae]|uniref:hypothetical protein n=1 Tax=Klebsiella quasipneumoniae TaxID=1463165 RepID=UPI003004CDB3
KACVLPENPASYRVVRTKSYLFNKAHRCEKIGIAADGALMRFHGLYPVLPGLPWRSQYPPAR